MSRIIIMNRPALKDGRTKYRVVFRCGRGSEDEHVCYEGA